MYVTGDKVKLVIKREGERNKKFGNKIAVSVDGENAVLTDGTVYQVSETTSKKTVNESTSIPLINAKLVNEGRLKDYFELVEKKETTTNTTNEE